MQQKFTEIVNLEYFLTIRGSYANFMLYFLGAKGKERKSSIWQKSKFKPSLHSNCSFFNRSLHESGKQSHFLN